MKKNKLNKNIEVEMKENNNSKDSILPKTMATHHFPSVSLIDGRLVSAFCPVAGERSVSIATSPKYGWITSSPLPANVSVPQRQQGNRGK